ncbi:hypothetical protein E4631_24045 [Hymenobacter sp. UV11]|uniref:hypothetical protein n=1 Tax=Hymenobacter sp. UV11 TaxID=1849735 RepID=UPI00105CBB69|nr:hypothetical protein [Hymenobacter sp. UV11]TFZ63003.1 hypothetical protein E4631_24045 [Hymenobacter sp. UV11]
MEVTDSKQVELAAAHNTKIYVIEGVGENGEALKMYLKKPDYKTKKAALETLMADSKAVIVAGEMILLACFVDGDNLYNNEDTRLEAAMAAAELVKFNDTIALKKS